MKKRNYLSDVEDRSGNAFSVIADFEGNEEQLMDIEVDGIFILDAEYENNIGEDIVEVLNLREDIIEFEITPNRPDCLSIEGLGRETAVSLKQEFKNPREDLQNMKVEAKEELEGLKVKM